MSTCDWRVGRFAAAAVAALVGAAGGADAAVTVTPVFLAGDPAPGMPSGYVFFEVVDLMMIAENGHVAVRIDVTNGVRRRAIYAGAPGALTLVAVEAGSVAGRSGVTYDSPFGSTLLDAGGRVVYGGPLLLDPVSFASSYALFTGAPASPAVVAETGFPAAGLPPQVQYLGFPEQAAAAGNGRYAFLADLETLGVPGFGDAGIWAGSGSGLELVARVGDSVGPSSAHFASLLLGDLSPSGGVLFRAELDQMAPWFRGSDPPLEITQQALIISSPATPPATDRSEVVLAATGSDAPGLPQGVKFTIFDSPVVVSDSGVAAFIARVHDTEFDPISDPPQVIFNQTDKGIWAGEPGDLHLLAQFGGQAPGTADGVRIASALLPELSENGSLAMQAILAGEGVTPENALIIYGGAPGDLSVVVRNGDPAPGMPESVRFFGLGRPAISTDGRVIFSAIARGPGVIDEFNDRGIWATDRQGRPRLVLRAQDQIQVAPGDVRTLESVLLAVDETSWSPTHGRRFFNGNGQFIARLAFTDTTSGVFVVTLPPDCRADFDGQNGVQVADIFAFLRAWFANAPSADFDGQNGIQVADIFAFLRAWFAGC